MGFSSSVMGSYYRMDCSGADRERCCIDTTPRQYVVGPVCDRVSRPAGA